MAGSTFLVLTNKLLRRLNEVELTDSAFSSAKNVHSAAKDCIVAAISEVNTRESQWPWNVRQGSATVSNGTQMVVFDTPDVTPNWDSFRLFGTPSFPLKPVSEEEWYAYHRSIDVDSVANGGRQNPRFVFPTTGGFGVTPMPEKPYTINYEYYRAPLDLVAYDDTSDIPTVWDYVVINMALKHYYMYKDNTEQASYWSGQAEAGFKIMRNALVNRPDAVWSNMVNFGGTNWTSNYTRF